MEKSWSPSLPISDLTADGYNAPRLEFNDVGVRPVRKGTAARLHEVISDEVSLDALLVNRDSDVLVVSFHGALNRGTTRLPQFERLAMLLKHDVSCLFFGDPTLSLSPDIQLAWYTGWEGFDLQQVLARYTLKVAAGVGASKVVFTGSSGGGFAALQVAALVQGSVAVAFNAQTDIAGYRVDGSSWGVQREYVRAVWPEVWRMLTPPGIVENGVWSGFVDDRISALRRYSSDRRNRVYVVQNVDEFHYEDHFLPFVATARAAGNSVFTMTNEEGPLHNPPRAETFNETLKYVLEAEREAKHSPLEMSTGGLSRDVVAAVQAQMKEVERGHSREAQAHLTRRAVGERDAKNAVRNGSEISS